MILLGHLIVAGLAALVLGLAFMVLMRRLSDKPTDGEVWHEMWTPKGRRWMP